jgi:hypothetical protein
MRIKKRKSFLFMLILCFVLTSCKKEATPTETDGAEVTKEEPITAATATPTTVVTKTPTVTASTTTGDNQGFDYSDHTCPNEADYKTILTDLSKLKEGKPLYATTGSVPGWPMTAYTSLTKTEGWGYDMRNGDVSKIDFSKIDDLKDISFNSETIWPEVLPEGFHPEDILEWNKNPGLGIRALHERGITGSNVSIAIIDDGLLLEHQEYKDNLMLYEKIHYADQLEEMNGPAVASIAVGKTIGVAPDAKLYYIAASPGHYTETSIEYDQSIYADCILRVLEMNNNLPEDEKIRVISISSGFDSNFKGYPEFVAAVDKAKADNIFVLTSTTENNYDFALFGVERPYMSDPNDVNSYTPASWILGDLPNAGNWYDKYILVPMGSRTYACVMGAEKYEFGICGGLRLTMPWCAGFYALCCQVKPDITPEEFLSIVKSTAVPANVNHDGTTYNNFGKIVNPAAVIEELGKSRSRWLWLRSPWETAQNRWVTSPCSSIDSASWWTGLVW